MVNQINAQLGLAAPLTLDQLTQIQQITNPGVMSAIGGAVGKLGGWLGNKGKQSVDAVSNQVANPESGLRQGLSNAGQAIATGVDKFQQGVKDGVQAVGHEAGAAMNPETEQQAKNREIADAAAKRKQQGLAPHATTAYAESQEIINSLKPGWKNQIVRIDYSETEGS